MTTKEIELPKETMSLLDFIGFIFAFAAAGYILIKKKVNERKERLNPIKRDKDYTLEEFLDSIQREETPPEEKIMPIKKKKLTQKIESKPIVKEHQHDFTFSPAGSYEVKRRAHIGRGTALVKSLKSKSDLFIINEIMDEPVALRKPKF